MKINIKELIDFFDDKKDSNKGDPNALIAMFGEELNASIFKHFMDNKVEVLEESVLPGTNKGNRLDRWIVDKKSKILFQCEIKNWASTAIRGKQLELSCSDEKLKETIKYYCEHELKNSFRLKKQPNGVTKVLLKMKPPKEYENYSLKPLVIYWMPISFDKAKPLSKISLKEFNFPFKTEFHELDIFSVSLYIRDLYKKGIKNIDLEMPILKHRIKLLGNLINSHSATP